MQTKGLQIHSWITPSTTCIDLMHSSGQSHFKSRLDWANMCSHLVWVHDDCDLSQCPKRVVLAYSWCLIRLLVEIARLGLWFATSRYSQTWKQALSSSGSVQKSLLLSWAPKSGGKTRLLQSVFATGGISDFSSCLDARATLMSDTKHYAASLFNMHGSWSEYPKEMGQICEDTTGQSQVEQGQAGTCDSGQTHTCAWVHVQETRPTERGEVCQLIPFPPLDLHIMTRNACITLII